MAHPFGYQSDQIDKNRALLSSGIKRILNVMPTGSGKTFTACHVMKSAAERGNDSLAVMHRQELVMQWSFSLAALEVDHSLIAPANVISAIRVQQVKELGRSFIKDDALCAIGSVQTIGRRMDNVRQRKIILPDEAHHAVAGTWQRILEEWAESAIIGWTATPIRLDGRGLGTCAGGIFDEMVLGPSVQEMIKMGRLVPARHFGAQHKLDMSGVGHGSNGDFKKSDLRKAMKEQGRVIYGDAVRQYRDTCPGAKAVVFCHNIEACEKVAAMFCEAGFRFAVIDGSLDDGERRRRVRALEDGTLHGLVSCDIVSEGFDLPAIECGIMLRPTDSLSLYLQQIGRVLRAAPGKEFAYIFDHVNNWEIHGFAHDDREWTLEGRKKGAKRSDDVGNVSIMMCQKCYSVHAPAPQCPYCGHVHPVKSNDLKIIDTKLTEIDEEAARRFQEKRRIEQAQAESIDDLRQVAKNAGYKKGYAWHVKNARERKQKAQANLKEVLREWMAETGTGCHQTFGITIGEVNRMSEKVANETADEVRKRLDEMASDGVSENLAQQAALFADDN